MKRARDNDATTHENSFQSELPEWWDETSLDDEDANEPDEIDLLDDDDARWDAFLADDDELDPLPDHGDFWFEDD